MRDTLPGDWSAELPDDQWALYRPVLVEASELRLPFLVAGGLAYSYYSGLWRNTKDLDVMIPPDDRPRWIELLERHGFADYFNVLTYDRAWIYRSHRAGVIIDVIWQMANYHAQVDTTWLERGEAAQVRDLPVRMLAPEELIFCKLYVFQRDRCDWPDLISVLYARGPHLDWPHLLNRLGEHWGLLRGLLCVFSWVCPDRAAELPESLWERLQIDGPSPGPPCHPGAERVRLLDSRHWFAPAGSQQTQPDPSR